MVQVMGRLLGVTLCFGGDLRLEIWDWMTGQKMTVIEMRDVDAVTRSYCTFVELLGATSIVVAHQGVLEVYEIPVEAPGAPPVRTGSFCVQRPNFDRYRSTVRITRNSRLLHGIGHGNVSYNSSFSSPSFSFAKDNRYFTILSMLMDFLTPRRGRKPNSMFFYLLFVARQRMETLYRYPGKRCQKMSISRMTLEVTG
ncbi:hypothetical protein BS47DRAFT_90350 [Hydnum rufescens UP504]|uniref:Uncharacterized protein n=1 Tax=Hydnum rufescens UP504 TaxID=1448309 RepID=A0A9P6DQT1_9AGAM|nr:hypothetical protein BS47DRAFT_90350 [Hydnum rufescens UP504]